MKTKNIHIAWQRRLWLAFGAACFALAPGTSHAEDLVPLVIKLPAEAFVGTPSDAPVDTTVEKPSGQPRPPLMVPPGVSNLALLHKGPQWVQIDLINLSEIYAVVVWHGHDEPKVYHAVVAQVADDAKFTQNVRTLYNNDHKNLDKLGAGTDREYFESHEGKLIEGKGTVARYVRLYSDGSTVSRLNEYTEIEVYGRPPK
jgi:hypothetical protein